MQLHIYECNQCRLEPLENSHPSTSVEGNFVQNFNKSGQFNNLAAVLATFIQTTSSLDKNRHVYLNKHNTGLS